MLFSIIIPCYNVEPFLAECLESVLSQSYADWEAICVDDGSTDESGRILDEYTKRDARIKVVHQENGGLSVARNTGMIHAMGEYLLFLDSDDVLTPNALDILNQQVTTHYPDVLTFNAELWYAEENRRECHYYSRNQYAVHATGRDYLIHFVQQHHWGPAAACFYCIRRTIIMKSQLLFEPGLLHEDELFVPQMLLATKGMVVEIPLTLYYYRMRSTSIMHATSSKNAGDILYIAAKLESELINAELPAPIRKSIVYNDAMLGINGFRSLHLHIPFSAFRLAWRNANWKRKLKLLRQFKIR